MARDRDGVVWHTACGGGFGRLRARVQPRRWAPPLAELARHAPGVQHWELRPRVRATTVSIVLKLVAVVRCIDIGTTVHVSVAAAA